MIKKHKMSIFLVLNLLMTIGMNLGHPVTPTFLTNLGMPSRVFGIGFAAMSLTNFIFALVWSNLGHTMKKTRILMISSFGYAVAQILFAFSSVEVLIYLARLLSGVFAGGFQVGFILYIVNEAPQEEQARFITLSSIIISVGAALGFFIGGTLGDVSIKLTFFVQAGLHLVVGALFYFLLGPLESVVEKKIDRDIIAKSNPFKVMQESRYLIKGFTLMLLISVLVSSMGTTLFDQSFGYYVKEFFGFLPSEFGLFKAMTGVLAIVLNLWIIKKKILNQEKMLRIIFILLGVLAVGLGFTKEMIFFVLVGLAWFGVYTVMLPVIQNLFVSQRTNIHEGNQLAGVYNAVSMLGKIAGALLTSFVYSIEPIATFYVAGGLFVISTLLILKKKTSR